MAVTFTRKEFPNTVTQWHVFFISFFLSFFFWCDNFHIGIQSNLSKNIQNHKHRVQCHSDLKQVFCSPQRRWVTLHLAASLTCTVEFTVWFPVKGRKKKREKMSACKHATSLQIRLIFPRPPYVGILSCLVPLSIMNTLERIDAVHNIFLFFYTS